MPWNSSRGRGRSRRWSSPLRRRGRPWRRGRPLPLLAPSLLAVPGGWRLSRAVVAEWLGRARAREAGFYSHHHPWRRGGRQGRDRDTCRVLVLSRLGLGVAGWLRTRWRLPIALVRSKRGAGGVTMAGGVGGRKQGRQGEKGGR